MYKLLVFTLFFFVNFSFADKIEVEKDDYLTLIVGSYVNGFNEFNTSVLTSEGSIMISIYYDISTQKKERAEQLANRFRFQVSKILTRYKWAKNVKIVVDVYSWDISSRGY